MGEKDKKTEEVILIERYDKNHKEINTETKKCMECEEVYTAKKKMQGYNICRMCNLSEHGCKKDNQPKKAKGHIWVCGTCLIHIDEMSKSPSERKELDELIKMADEAEKNSQNPEEINKANLEKYEAQRNKHTLEEIKTNEKNGQKAIEIEERTRDKDKNKVVVNGINIYREDLGTLKKGEYVSDTPISAWFNHVKSEICDEREKIVLIPTSVTQLIKHAEGIEEVQQTIGPLIPVETEYVIMAVNDNQNCIANGGSHWQEKRK